MSKLKLVGTDKYSIELGFRMLQPNELAATTRLPKDYKFTGTKVDVVKQIENAVPLNFAKAMFGQILSEITAEVQYKKSKTKKYG